MSKIAYIIPGYGESHTKQKGYDQIAAMFVQQAIKPVHVSIKWTLKKPTDFELYNKQFLKKYKKDKNDKTYVLGFSFGAIIAFLTASQAKPNVLILCSLSPYFTEDYKNMKPSWIKWWKKEIRNSYTFKDVPTISVPEIYIVAGSKEPPAVLFRARSTKRKFKNSKLIIAEDSKHNISQKEYLYSLEELIREF